MSGDDATKVLWEPRQLAAASNPSASVEPAVASPAPMLQAPGRAGATADQDRSTVPSSHRSDVMRSFAAALSQAYADWTQHLLLSPDKLL